MNRTMRVLGNALAILLVALLYHQTCLAQVDPWERVKLIEPGRNVHVKLHSGKTVKGRMESWNADGLTLRQRKDKLTPVAKSDVAEVSMVIGMSRGRKAAYAGLIGGAVGAGVFGTACAATGECADVAPAIAAGGAVWVGGIAAGIAALFPRHKEVVYTAKSLPRP